MNCGNYFQHEKINNYLILYFYLRPPHTLQVSTSTLLAKAIVEINKTHKINLNIFGIYSNDAGSYYKTLKVKFIGLKIDFIHK